jgi:hypothetical protein
MKSDSDNYQRMNKAPVQVIVTLATGAQMRGNLYVPKTRSLHDELNKGEMFIEFEPMDRQKLFLARSSIASVKEHAVPKADQLTRRLVSLDQFDAYEVLGLKKGADAAKVRAAYVQLAKAYHPDRFIRADLPQEVAEYLSAVATRINLAYSELRLTVPGSNNLSESAA